MGSYAEFRIGGLCLGSTKGGIDSSLMLLFTESDKSVQVLEYPARSCSESAFHDGTSEEEKEEPDYRVEYRASSTIIRDRLECMGYSLNSTKQVFQASLKEEIKRNAEQLEELASTPDIMRSLYEREGKVLNHLTFESWLESFAIIISQRLIPSSKYWYQEKDSQTLSPSVRFLLGGALSDGVWSPFNDIRQFLRAAVEVTSVQNEVVYDISELIRGGYYKIDESLAELSRKLVVNESLLNHKVIVITEGSTDKQALEGSLKLLYPHLAEYYSFLDFYGTKAPGGAGVLVSTIKSFIGAGVANRIVALFDNDTAAHDARRALRDVYVPVNVRILHYPPVEWAREYPTLGPQGLTSMDVNGLAGGLELYFGLDILRQREGNLTPVQWRGYVEGKKQYQGEILNKAELQSRFAEKLALCLADPQSADQYDWSGMKAILDALRTAFHTP